jgi:hypothetical protein
MRDLYAAAHVVIVPTTTDFIEGFNQVVAEGVMAGRPAITSSVCPALEYVAEAVVEVPPDDVTAYGDAVMRLADDREFYEARRRGCRAVAGQFYDDRLSWRAALSAALDGLRSGAPAAPRGLTDAAQPVAASRRCRCRRRTPSSWRRRRICRCTWPVRSASSSQAPARPIRSRWATPPCRPRS